MNINKVTLLNAMKLSNNLITNDGLMALVHLHITNRAQEETLTQETYLTAKYKEIWEIAKYIQIML